LGVDNFSLSASAAPSVVPVLLAIQANGGNGIITWSSVAGSSYQPQFKDDLGSPSWTPLGSPIPGTGLPLSITNSIGASSHRFFRLQIQP
jgi:hypothetical protein